MENEEMMTTEEISRLIDWLVENGCSYEKAADCIQYIAKAEHSEEEDEMSEAALYAYLSTLADLVEAKAKTPEEAVKIIREKASKFKPAE